MNKFDRRIKIETFLKSLICGISAGLSILAILLIIFKVIGLSTNVWVFTFIGVALSVLFTFGFTKLIKPNEAKMAARLDKDVNLQERVKTMVEFKNEDSPMIKLQREDTMEKLSSVPEKSFKIKLSASNYIFGILAMCSLALAILIPSREITPSAENPTESESVLEESQPSSSDEQTESESESEGQGGDGESGENTSEVNRDEVIDGAIDDIQQDVNESEADSSLQDQINSELEDLRDDLKQDETNEEVNEDIDQTQEDINEQIDQAISRDEIGEALKNQDTTENLGDPVSNGDTESTSSSLDELRDSLQGLEGDELKEALEQIAQDIQNALEQSGVDSEDELYQAFDNLGDSLQDIASNPNSDDVQDQIDDAFETAKEEISNALDNQNALEDLQQQINDSLDELQQQLTGNGDGQQGDEGQDGEQGEGEGEGEGEDGEQGDNPGGDGAGAGEGNMEYASDDLIYNPETNSYVTYGEILEYYYTHVLNGVESGQIPEDIQNIIFEYFASLNSDK